MIIQLGTLESGFRKETTKIMISESISTQMGIKCYNDAKYTLHSIRSIFTLLLVSIFSYYLSVCLFHLTRFLHRFFFCFLSFCQHFFFLYFFQPSHLLLPFLSVSVTSFFLTFSLLLIAYFHFLIFFLRVYSCIYRFQTFPSCLFPGTQKYTRQSEVFRISP